MPQAPMGFSKRGANTDPRQGKARMGLDGQRGSRALTQILFIAGVIVAVGAIFVLAGILLSDGGGKGVAWTILGGLAVLVVILAAVRRRRTVSLEESLPTRTRES